MKTKIIVKYENRKLYDNESHSYISIVELVKLPLGSFKIIKYGTAEDVTTELLLNALNNDAVGNREKVKVMEHCIEELNGVMFNQ